MSLLHNLFDLYLEAAPWLLLGLVMAGLLKAWLPPGMLQQKLGQGRFLPVIKASLIGAPLPLCSCGVLPAAMALRRSGASKSATVSFMISTPETGPDSIAITYALLGPFMALLRPVAAVVSALFTGLLNNLFDSQQEIKQPSNILPVIDSTASGCSEGACCAVDREKNEGIWQRSVAGLKYAFTAILDDIGLWLIAGLILAALVMSYIPTESLSSWGSGLPAMLMMLLVGIPMYICATASTPLAAAMILAGISPGTVLVFLLAGPATNLATIGVIHREMGVRTLVIYLLGISLSSILIGLATDSAVTAFNIPVEVLSSQEPPELIEFLAILSGLLLLFFMLGSVRRKLNLF
ncbi:MAG: SO_0444 family Cu/Zn efflux transporter [Candidatus Thiodiazotropha sp. 6PLUC2]